MNKFLFGAALSLGLLCVQAVRADDKALDDKGFVTKALHAGRMEVKLGELAEKQATNAHVKEFAARMVKDHTEANNKLEELARNQKAAAATEPKPGKENLHDKLSKLSGEEFDRAYMKHMVTDHEKAVALFEREAKNGQDADVKKFAEMNLPTIQAHLKMAKEISESLGKDK